MDSQDDYESRLQAALKETRDGGLSYAQASKKHGVGLGTLYGRAKGAKPRREAHEHEKKLSPRLELSIQQWILFEEAANRPPTKGQVRDFAKHLCELSGSDAKIGQHWVDRFISRHPQLHMKVGVPLSTARVEASTKERLEEFLRAVDDQMRRKRIKTANVINMDENGVGAREIIKRKVVGSSDSTTSTVNAPEKGPWTTILEGITAEGRRLTPVMVLQGETLQLQHIPRVVPPYRWIHSQNGWSTADICHRWLTDVFLPETATQSIGEWRLLLLDGSSTHLSPSLMARAWHEKTIIRYLPAHTSHLAQPCDKGPFSPLKHFYREEVARQTYLFQTAAISKRLTIRCYKAAAEKAFTKRNILSGFSHTGIVPFNPQKLLESIPPDEDLRPANRPPERVSTPTRPPETSIYTPQKATDLFAMANRIVQGQNALERDVQDLVLKAGKRLDNSLGEIALLQHENDRLNTLVEELRPRKRRRIQRDPNQAFADVARAMGGDDTPSRRRRPSGQAGRPDPQEISYTTLMHREEELQHSFHI